MTASARRAGAPSQSGSTRRRMATATSASAEQITASRGDPERVAAYAFHQMIRSGLSSITGPAGG